MKEIAPNLLDIDNVCHHVHNCVKLFCKNFDHVIKKLLDDLHTDFDFGTDLCTYLEEICLLLGIKYTKPKERVAHRWLSVLDCCVILTDMWDALIVFYFSWLSLSDKQRFNGDIIEILKGVSKESRQRIYQILKQMKLKNLTSAGKDRKRRIAERFFDKRDSTGSLMEVKGLQTVWINDYS